MPFKNMFYFLYKKLIALYPKEFKEQFSESMQQTFNDLYKEKQNTNQSLFNFITWTFAETSTSILYEHIFSIQEINMKNFFTNPKTSALISLCLALPMGLIYLIFLSDIGFLTQILNRLFTITGDGGDINMFGRIVLFGGMLLLPIAFILNVVPMFQKNGINSTRTLNKFNIIISTIILLLITFTWGTLILESISCLQGIYCD